MDGDALAADDLVNDEVGLEDDEYSDLVNDEVGLVSDEVLVNEIQNLEDVWRIVGQLDVDDGLKDGVDGLDAIGGLNETGVLINGVDGLISVADDQPCDFDALNAVDVPTCAADGPSAADDPTNAIDDQANVTGCDLTSEIVWDPANADLAEAGPVNDSGHREGAECPRTLALIVCAPESDEKAAIAVNGLELIQERQEASSDR